MRGKKMFLEELVTLRELSEKLDIDESYVKRALIKNKVPLLRMGKSKYIMNVEDIRIAIKNMAMVSN